MRGVLRDREGIEPHQRPFLGDHVGDLDAVLGLLGTLFRLHHVARIAHREAEVAGREPVDVFRGVELPHRAADLEQGVRDLGDVVPALGVGLEAVGRQHAGDQVLGGIEHHHAAILELAHERGAEDEAPGVEGLSRAEALAHGGQVYADAGRAPHVVDGVGIAGIVDGEALGDLGPGIAQVRELGLVEGLEHARPDQPLKERAGGHDDVVAGAAGQQLRLQDLVVVVGVVDDLDAGLLREGLEHLRVDVVRPIVDVDDSLRILSRRRAGPEEREGEGPEKGAAPHRARRAATTTISTR